MRNPIRTAMTGGALLALLACTPEHETLRLVAGETCDRSDECHSGHCELAANAPEKDPSRRICCQVSCTEGTRCDGTYCRPECVGDNCRDQNELGEACEWADECASGFCEPDEQGLLSCCEDDCSDFGLVCVFGLCGCPDGSLPSQDGTCSPESNTGDAFDPFSDADPMALVVGDGGGPSVLEGPPSGSELDEVETDAGTCGIDCAGSTSTCGNQRVDAHEECDGQLSCTDECLTADCGNGRLDPGEECEPPGTAACSEHCLVLGCGNGRLEDGEECEPPAVGACDEHCWLPRCGNDRIDGDEECDPPVPGRCDSKCRTVSCGNKRVEETEGCDPPLPGVCSDECRPLGCGDSSEDAGEECDPPTYGSCSGSCLDIVCGNRRVDEGEECDPPTEGECSEACKKIECGNGRIDRDGDGDAVEAEAEAEECDPPHPGECAADCRAIECGNQRIDEGEECEPAAASSSDCSPYCTRIVGDDIYLYTFGASSQGWRPSASTPTSLLVHSTVQHATDGDASSGSLTLVAAFDGAAQRVDFTALSKISADLSAHVLVARIRLEAGPSSTTGAVVVRLIAKSGPHYDYAAGSWLELEPSQAWTDISFDAAAPALQPDDFDPGDVREIGLEIATLPSSADAATATLSLDSVILAPR